MKKVFMLTMLLPIAGLYTFEKKGHFNGQLGDAIHIDQEEEEGSLYLPHPDNPDILVGIPGDYSDVINDMNEVRAQVPQNHQEVLTLNLNALVRSIYYAEQNEINGQDSAANVENCDDAMRAIYNIIRDYLPYQSSM